MMHSILLIELSAFLLVSICQASTSSKRGLVYVPSKRYPSDDSIWDSPGSDLTWYYNYQTTPSPSYAASTKLLFVPMLYGASDSNSDTTFLEDIRLRIENGENIPYVLAFNEPDGQGNGGSNVPVDTAVEAWIRQIEPLKELGVKLGAPAVTGAPSGKDWLQNFFRACDGRCTIDFIPVHWYGNFDGLASHIGEIREAYPSKAIWITEYAYNDASLLDSQIFYNSSSEYFDRIDYITHYSYFGSFRSDVSNVGPNAAMLTQRGELTDIGSLYLGGSKTGKIPKSDAGEKAVFTPSGLLLLGASLWLLM